VSNDSAPQLPGGARRFFCEHLPAAGQRFALPDRVFHHAVRVRRLRAGETLTLFDANGREALARLAAVGRDAAEVQVLGVTVVDRESPLDIVLLQGISSGERMDYTLQKAIELGVAAIVPVATERSIVRLSGERAEKRVSRWREVVVSACEQCGRNRVPPVTSVRTLDEALRDVQGAMHVIRDETQGGMHGAIRGDGRDGDVGGDMRGDGRSGERGGDIGHEVRRRRAFVLSTSATRRLREIARPEAGIVLLAGPEGGLAPHETALALRSGFEALSLGPRVLRTETAAVAALAAIQALWGDG